MILRALPLALVASLATVAVAVAVAEEVSTPPEPFTEEYLADPAHIEAGEAIWQEQCRHCHGAAAYPGKAPKLTPVKYEPDFVYRRVTDGFRRCPAGPTSTPTRSGCRSPPTC